MFDDGLDRYKYELEGYRFECIRNNMTVFHSYDLWKATVVTRN